MYTHEVNQAVLDVRTGLGWLIIRGVSCRFAPSISMDLYKSGCIKGEA